MTKGYDEKRTPEQIAEEKARHESLKKKLKIGGTAALAVGLVCTIVAFVNFFTVFGNPDAGMPKLFFPFLYRFAADCNRHDYACVRLSPRNGTLCQKRKHARCA